MRASGSAWPFGESETAGAGVSVRGCRAAISINPTGASYLTVYPADVSPRPTTSTLNWLGFAAPSPNATGVHRVQRSDCSPAWAARRDALALSLGALVISELLVRRVPGGHIHGL